MIWWVDFSKSPDCLSMEVKMEAKKYILCLLRQTKFLFDNYFYEFKKYEPQVIEICLIDDTIICGTHALYKKYHKIKINIAWAYFKDAESYSRLPLKLLFDERVYLKRKIFYLALLIHEYAHGVYGNVVGGYEIVKFRTANSAEIALTEGFSMISKIIIIDLLNEETESMKKVDLTYDDILGLKKLSLKDDKERLTKIFYEDNPDKDIYVEGLHSLIYPIYNESGLGGLRQFLENIDFLKAIKIKRDAPEYLEAFGDAAKIRKLFCK